MKKEVGASVYVGLKEYPLEENLKYLDLCKEVGISHVFISAHIPEMNDSFLFELKEVLKYASKIGLKMIIDINKKVYDEIKDDLNDAYALRLDYGFSIDEVAKMSKVGKFVVELNASTMSPLKINELKSLGVDLSKIRLSHNFYPKIYTGLDRERVRELNKRFKEYGINVAIYIPSNNMKRPPMYEGLPSIEEHRFMDLESILSEVDPLMCDEVIFGDSYASKEELLTAINFDYSEAIIKIRLNKDITSSELEQIKKIHYNRSDAPIYFIRSSVRSNDEIIPRNPIERKKLDVTIDNRGMRRYMGEVCIMLTDLEADERVNVVGEVVSSIDTVNEIYRGRKFRFKVVE